MSDIEEIIAEKKEIDSKQIVDIPFHGKDVEGIEAVRLNLVACSKCGGFDFMIALVDPDNHGDLQAFVCSKCRVGLQPETISIKTFNNLMDKARKQYVKAHNIMKIYRFGFFMAAGFIIFKTFIE